MPQLSRYPIGKDFEIKITRSLYESIVLISTKEEAEQFLADLLTPNEKLMLAKRLSIAMFLEKGYTFEEISSVLKVSTSTISVISNWLKTSGRGYRRIIEKIKKDLNISEIFLIANEHIKNFKGQKGPQRGWR